LFRLRQQYHVIRVSDQPNVAEGDPVAPAPLTIYLVQKDVGQRWRNHSALRRTSIRVSHLAFLHNSRFQPGSDQAQDLNVSDPAFHQLYKQFVRNRVEGNHDTLPTVSSFPSG
jgi:hypothetical protein